MHFPMNLQVLAGLGALLPVTNAFFRMPCGGPLSLQRADPVVNPGKVSTHVHNIVGGNGFGLEMNFASTQAATCSSCKAKKDKSNYWIPHLYVKTKAGKFNSVNNGGATIYYLQRRGSNNEKLVAFPDGFRMLAGDPMRRSFDPNNVEHKAISFVCLGGSSGETHYMPNAKCPDGLRLQIVMPSCWDGKNLDSANHKSHVAYPARTDSGNCPLTHSVRLITMFYEFIYDVRPYDNEWVDNKHPFVLANGDPTGYGHHADFVNGWHRPTLQKAIDECNNNSGIIEDCSVLELYSNSQMDDCTVPSSINEQVEGLMDQLPGCNPISAGPAPAPAIADCKPAVIGPNNSLGTDVSSKGWSYVGCASDDLGSRTFPYRTSSNTMTVETCIDICVGQKYVYAGLQYSEECWCGNQIAQNRLGATKCTMTCSGNKNQYCGGPAKLSVYKKSTPARKMAVRRSMRRNVRRSDIIAVQKTL